MERTIEEIFKESIGVKERTLASCRGEIMKAARALKKSLRAKGKVLLFGNGGSAADSQHIAAELVGRFRKERRALAALALTTDTSVLTSVGNDYGYELVFARQVEGLGSRRDVAVGISTSGNSKNVIAGLKAAKKLKMTTVSLTGGDGGVLARISDININVPSRDTARIQETHICIGHILCELVEA
jgi:D-sedoheptulose 7-phosphate isomerase